MFDFDLYFKSTVGMSHSKEEMVLLKQEKIQFLCEIFVLEDYSPGIDC